MILVAVASVFVCEPLREEIAREDESSRLRDSESRGAIPRD